VAATVRNPPDGVAGAACVVGADVVACAGARLLGVLVCAAVETEKFVADLAARSDGEDVVGSAVDA
jgi:hypothetical protein